MEKKIVQTKDLAWIKTLLNNMPLIKWVKKYSADNLNKDNALAEKYGVKCNEQSISVGDTTMVKLLVTQARYGGKEFCRFNLKQIQEVVALLGCEGELIVSADNQHELFIQIKDTVIVVCPLPVTDSKK